MTNNKTKKYLSVTSSVALMLSLTACGTEEGYVEVHTEDTFDEQMVTSHIENEEVIQDDEEIEQLQGIEDSEYAESCDSWTVQEDGSYYCDDEHSQYHGNYFFNGLMFATLGAMVGSSLYKQKNLTNGTMRQNVKRNDEQTGSSSSGGGGAGSAIRSGSSQKSTTTNGSNSNGQSSSQGSTSNSSGTIPSGGKSGFGSGGSSYGGASS